MYSKSCQARQNLCISRTLSMLCRCLCYTKITNEYSHLVKSGCLGCILTESLAGKCKWCCSCVCGGSSGGGRRRGKYEKTGREDTKTLRYPQICWREFIGKVWQLKMCGTRDRTQGRTIGSWKLCKSYRWYSTLHAAMLEWCGRTEEVWTSLETREVDKLQGLGDMVEMLHDTASYFKAFIESWRANGFKKPSWRDIRISAPKTRLKSVVKCISRGRECCKVYIRSGKAHLYWTLARFRMDYGCIV